MGGLGWGRGGGGFSRSDRASGWNLCSHGLSGLVIGWVGWLSSLSTRRRRRGVAAAVDHHLEEPVGQVVRVGRLVEEVYQVLVVRDIEPSCLVRLVVVVLDVAAGLKSCDLPVVGYHVLGLGVLDALSGFAGDVLYGVVGRAKAGLACAFVVAAPCHDARVAGPYVLWAACARAVFVQPGAAVAFYLAAWEDVFDSLVESPPGAWAAEVVVRWHPDGSVGQLCCCERGVE